MIPRYAVIPTHNRPDELARAIEALAPQCDVIMVIDNASTPPVDSCRYATSGVMVAFVRDDEQPPNLSRLWNRGLDFCASRAGMGGALAWDVAIVNDDAIVPPGWFDAVAKTMRQTDCVAGSSAPFDMPLPNSAVYTDRDEPPGVHNRLTGWAFILRGEAGLRFDERLRWWCGDDLISWQARRAGGLVHVGGYPVPNTGANSSTVGVLAEQAARDMQTFVDITGTRPW